MAKTYFLIVGARSGKNVRNFLEALAVFGANRTLPEGGPLGAAQALSRRNIKGLGRKRMQAAREQIMLLTEAKFNDFFVIEAAEPFTGIITIGRHNGGKRICFDFPKTVKIRKNPSGTRTGHDENNEF